MKIFLVVLLGLPLGFPAFAGTHYGQIDMGIAQYENVDDVDGSFGAKVGTQLIDNGYLQVFLEGGYKDFGTMETGNRSEEIDIHSYSLGLKFSALDIYGAEIYGLAGGHYWESSINSDDDESTDPYLGVSIEVPVTKAVNVGIGYNHFWVKDDSISQLELKILYNF